MYNRRLTRLMGGILCFRRRFFSRPYRLADRAVVSVFVVYLKHRDHKINATFNLYVDTDYIWQIMINSSITLLLVLKIAGFKSDLHNCLICYSGI